MKSKKEEVFELLVDQRKKMSASEVAEVGQLDRANTSRYLNELVKENRVEKDNHRPVNYWIKKISEDPLPQFTFDLLIGSDYSLKNQIQKAKAAMLYPPKGLDTLIFGETGTGKTLFAECMYNFGVSLEVIAKDAPFITFNCADYAQNPQLLFSHIFGVKKGAYTGAEETREGLVAKADGGILFLDEIHRLPPEGQEMLFTFIDKGVYRPLGESKEQSASVQIIGATTETSAVFLETFNRRIPMQIELPPLDERTLDERLAIINDFLQQESNRLNQEIELDKFSLLAFILYRTEGNVGQLKRDLKLVCAKAFLHYSTAPELDHLVITKEELPLNVQKGLLRLNEVSDQVSPLIDNRHTYLHFEPGEKEIVWSRDPSNNMDVYNTITYKLDALEENNLGTLDLEKLIANDVDRYFDNYMEELSHSNTYQDIVSDKMWHLVSELYKIAQEKIHREYSEKTRFAFALHLQSMIERIQTKQIVAHPDLNNVRRKYPQEFQLAIEFSTRIEAVYDIIVPMDEIGFITMFLTHEISAQENVPQDSVAVFVVMHGNSTASSMLEAVQDLLGMKSGYAFDMPLTMKAETMYQLLLDYVRTNKQQFKQGILLLTDMGSPSNFGQLIEQEVQLPIRVRTMSSTMVVLESIRMSALGRSLEEIDTSLQTMLGNIFHKIEPKPLPKKIKNKAIVVSCFTGEGVAKKIENELQKYNQEEKVKILPIQFLERSHFYQKLKQLEEEWEIQAIIGTVDVSFKEVPFFPAICLFEGQLPKELQVLLGNYQKSEDVTMKKIFQELLPEAEKSLHQMMKEAAIEINPDVSQAIAIHLATLMDRRNTYSQIEQDEKQVQTTIVENHQVLETAIKQQFNQLQQNHSFYYTSDDVIQLMRMILQE